MTTPESSPSKAPLFWSGRDPFDGLTMVAVSLVVALPGIFHLYGFQALRWCLTTDEVFILLGVYGAALIVTLWLGGLVALAWLISRTIGAAVLWVLFFFCLYRFFGHPSQSAALTYVLFIAYGLLLHWHLLPMYVLSHLDQLAGSSEPHGSEPQPAAQVPSAIARTQRLCWALTICVAAVDVLYVLGRLATTHAGVGAAVGVSVVPILGASVLVVVVLRRVIEHDRESHRGPGHANKQINGAAP